MFTIEIEVEPKNDEGFIKATVRESNHQELIGYSSFAKSEKKAVAFLLDQIAQYLKK